MNINEIIKKGYYYSYSFLRISYIYIYRLIYKNYTEQREAIKQEDINYISNIYALFYDCDYIIDNIYLGSCYNASNENLLKELNIKKIVNISDDIPNYHNDIEYYNYKIKDDGIEQFNLEEMNKLIDFIKTDDRNILIHCVMGKSRSVTVVLYYLMKIHNMSLENALEFLNKKRNVINPSICFIKYLQNIENNKI